MLRNVVIFIMVLIILMILFRELKREPKVITKPVKVPKVVEVDHNVNLSDSDYSAKKNIRAGVRFSEQEDVRVFDPSLPPYSISDLNYGPKQMDAVDRIRNPLRYPYKSAYSYQPQIAVTDQLPFQVVGGGRRREPALNAGYAPMLNPPTAINIGGQNIAPIGISVRGGLGLPQQVGVIMKIFGGEENDIHPLFGRKRFPRDHKWDYYTTLGKDGVKLKVRNVNNNQRFDELSSNDEVFVQGLKDRYRVIIYESDFPQYI